MIGTMAITIGEITGDIEMTIMATTVLVTVATMEIGMEATMEIDMVHTMEVDWSICLVAVEMLDMSLIKELAPPHIEWSRDLGHTVTEDMEVRTDLITVMDIGEEMFG